MSTSAPLQYKSTRSNTPVRQKVPFLTPSRGILPSNTAPVTEPGAPHDRQHVTGFSLSHIPIDSPAHAPRNTFEEHRKNNTGLPNKLKAGIERLSGMALDDVRVHYHSSKPAEVEALAYTRGTDIHVGPGEEQHLAHEAWHVVQQKQGRVKPTLQAKGVEINDDQGLEKEADELGTRALQGNWASSRQVNPLQQSNRSVVQRNGNNKRKKSAPSGDSPSKKKKANTGTALFDDTVNMDIEQRSLEQKRQTRSTKKAIEGKKKQSKQQKKEDPVLASLVPNERTPINKGLAISRALFSEANAPDSEIEESDIQAIFRTALLKYEAYKEELKKQLDRSRRTEVKGELLQAWKQAITDAWLNYSDILPDSLEPAGEIFQERPFTGNERDSSKRTYHTGKDATDAIPIIWYKPPDAYPKIRTEKKNVFKLQGGASVVAGTTTILKPDSQNIPPDKPDPTSSFILKKKAHNEARTDQKQLNQEINAYADVEGKNGQWVSNALGTKGGFDGDHIKDLGFGGKDDNKNYWPLTANINRRAFNGYNSRYIVNYKKEDGSLAAKPVGGMIGKFFKVKGYMDSSSNTAIPDETEKPYAGTWDNT